MFAAYIESTKLNSNFQFRILKPNVDRGIELYTLSGKKEYL